LGITVEGSTLVPFPERALYWKETETLFIADLHIGKAESFRTHGIAIPHGTTDEDLERLSAVIRKTAAVRLVVLGDLFHDSAAQDERIRKRLSDWGGKHPDLDIAIVPGNHDRRSGPPHPELGWTILEEGYRQGPFEFRHVPEGTGRAYVLAGHVHPVVRIRERRASIRVPCFHFSRRSVVLPAFSLFTGGAVIQPRAEDLVFAVAGDSVVQVDALSCASSRRRR
jgi:DNA ligase-associated metallophosphoesterase